MTNYKIERDAILRRWYGNNPQARNSQAPRFWPKPMRQNDYLSIPIPVNPPFIILGYCMVWKYSLNQDGYGVIRVNGKNELAHRVAYIQAKGSIPDGKQINHLCNQPYCVQPTHIYAGDQQDNRDDSGIFGSSGFIAPVNIILMNPEAEFINPLLRRLRTSERWEQVNPWNPPEQPPQVPMEEFTCPGHDFRIPMQFGETKLCRICERFEQEGEFYDSYSIFLIAKDICPISQYADSILIKVGNSELAGESHKEWRSRIYHRSVGVGLNHDIRNCECQFCFQDRQTFRNALQESLTQQEGDILDICNRLEPHIRRILEEACGDMLEESTKSLGFSDDQIRELRKHVPECTKSELKTHRGTIEALLGYHLYAMTEYKTMKDLEENRAFKLFAMRLKHVGFQMTEEQYDRIEPLMRKASGKLMDTLEREGRKLIEEIYGTEPTEIYHQIRWFTNLITNTEVLELLRYHLTGRNSSRSRFPHPHEHCINSINSILETGKVELFKNPWRKERDCSDGNRTRGKTIEGMKEKAPKPLGEEDLPCKLKQKNPLAKTFDQKPSAAHTRNSPTHSKGEAILLGAGLKETQPGHGCQRVRAPGYAKAATYPQDDGTSPAPGVRRTRRRRTHERSAPRDSTTEPRGIRTGTPSIPIDHHIYGTGKKARARQQGPGIQTPAPQAEKGQA